MKKTDIYEIAIKLFGIHLAIFALTQVKDFFISLCLFPNHNDILTDKWMILSTGLIALGTILLDYFLLFKTQKIGRLITQSSDKEILNLPLTKKEIYQVGLILAGILTIVFSLPELFYEVKNLLTPLREHIPTDKIRIIFPIVKVIIGVLLVKFSVTLSNYINDKIK